MRSCTLWSLRNALKSYVINIMFGGIETTVYADSPYGSESVTNAALALLELPAEAWISTEEYANG